MLLGLVGRLLLALVSLVVAKWSAQASARRPDRALPASISDLLSTEVIALIEAELAAYDRTRAALRDALSH